MSDAFGKVMTRCRGLSQPRAALADASFDRLAFEGPLLRRPGTPAASPRIDDPQQRAPQDRVDPKTYEVARRRRDSHMPAGGGAPLAQPLFLF